MNTAYKIKKPGRHPEQISPNFAKKVVYLRNTTDYGSVKLHVVLKRADDKLRKSIVKCFIYKVYK